MGLSAERPLEGSSSSEASPVAAPGRRHFWRSFKRRFARRASGAASDSSSQNSPTHPQPWPESKAANATDTSRGGAAHATLTDTAGSQHEKGGGRAALRHRAGRFSRWRSSGLAADTAAPSSRGDTGVQHGRQTSGAGDEDALHRSCGAESARSCKEGTATEANRPTLKVPQLSDGASSSLSVQPGLGARVPPRSAPVLLSSLAALPPHCSAPGSQDAQPPLWLLEEAPASVLSYPPSYVPRSLLDRQPLLGGWEDSPASPARGASTESSSLSEEDVRRPPLPRPSTPSNYSSSPSNYSSRDSSPSGKSTERGHRPQGGGIGPLFRGRKSQRQIERMSASWNGWDPDLLSTWENDSSPECSAQAGDGSLAEAAGRGGGPSTADSGLPGCPPLEKAGQQDSTAQQHEQGGAAGGWFKQLPPDDCSNSARLGSTATQRQTAPPTARQGAATQAHPTQIQDSPLFFPPSAAPLPSPALGRRPPSPSPPPSRTAGGASRLASTGGGSRSRTANVYRSALLGGGRGPSPNAAASRSSRAAAFTSSAAARASQEGLPSQESTRAGAPQRDRGSMSRIVALAEALFEVLDELQAQGSPSLPWQPPPSAQARQPAPGAVVHGLPLHVFQRQHHAGGGAAKEADTDALPQCYICLTEYLQGDRLRRLPCGHEYHSACIDKWLLQVHRVCPVCRRDVCIVVADTSPVREQGTGDI